MAVETITLRLPDSVMRFAEQAASALQHPLEDVLASMLTAVVPDLGDVPDDLRSEVARLTFASDRELWQIARSSLRPAQQRQLNQLLRAQSERGLTEPEQEKLEKLRLEYGRITLLKARAYALLSMRSGQPLLRAD